MSRDISAPHQKPPRNEEKPYPMFENLLAALLAVGLLVYLIYALTHPEKF
ncbi:K(+)-transporting ATPase subunit F [Austwickia chelonae]|nr:K(+)-transporting ATPase subunit F [Austwickia chelonae]